MENEELIIQAVKDVVEPLLTVKEALFIKKLDSKSVNSDEEENLDDQEVSTNKTLSLLICLDSADFFKFIANHGVVASATKEIIHTIARKYKVRLDIKYENLSSEE